MIRYAIVRLLAAVAVQTVGAVVFAESAASENRNHQLPDTVIMHIGGTDIPYDWFLHEFRSTFFRHAHAEDVRQAVFEPFKKRMLLYTRATHLGIDQQPELMRDIENRISDLRAFMDYQLAMTRIDMINNALIRESGFAVSTNDLSEEELADFFNRRIKNRPGAPPSYEMIPAHLRDSMRHQAAQDKLERKLDEWIAGWQNEIELMINHDAVENVPFPEMKGSPPPDFERSRR